MTDTRKPEAFVGAAPVTPTILKAIRVQPKIALVAVVFAIGVFINWDAWIAAGIAVLIIYVVPCAAMRALELWMNRMGGSPCMTGPLSRQPSTATAESLQIDSVAGWFGEPEPGDDSVGPTS